MAGALNVDGKMKLAGALLLLTAGLGMSGAAEAATCDGHPADIAVGGVDGFESLVNSKATESLRSTCRVRLYLHDYVWERATEAVRASVAKAFSGTWRPSLEVGETSHPREFWRKHFESYGAANLSPTEAHVNLTDNKGALTPAQWRDYVQAARSYGVEIVAPVFAPNMGEWKEQNFSSPAFDKIKQYAKYGGGLTLDSPPDYFLRHPERYQKFVADEIRWAQSKCLKATGDANRVPSL